jgi:hypothetical protein
MENSLNKYGLTFDPTEFERYCDFMIADCYKILPIYEGRNPHNKNVFYGSEIAYENYCKYMDNFAVELSGAVEIFKSNANFIKLLNIIEGMRTIKMGEHDKVKSLVFMCIGLCKRLNGGG